jgi:hypothetical protein
MESHRDMGRSDDQWRETEWGWQLSSLFPMRPYRRILQSTGHHLKNLVSVGYQGF